MREYLELRRGVYQFRLKVPADIMPALDGKTVFRKSLRTGNKRVAARRAKDLAGPILAEFQNIRDFGFSALDVSSINNFLNTKMMEILRDGETSTKNRVVTIDPTPTVTTADLAPYASPFNKQVKDIQTTQSIIAFYTDLLAEREFDAIESKFEEFLTDNEINIPKNTPQYLESAESFLKGLINIESIYLQRLEFDAEKEDDSSNTPSESPEQIEVCESDTLSKTLENWTAEHERAGGAPKTIKDFSVHIDRFIDMHGDMHIHEIKPRDVVEFKNAVLNLPSRMTNKERALPFMKQIRICDNDPERKRISPRTVNDKVLGALSAVLGHAEKDKKIHTNPASRIKVKIDRRNTIRRLPYSTEDLQTIFQFPIYTERDRPKAGAGEASVWLPLLALYTGARLEELGQMMIADIKQKQGIWCIDMLNIEDGAGHHFKNDQSHRVVPIHHRLIDLGFIQYVDGMKFSNQRKLFPLLKSSVDQTTANYSKWWGRYARKHGNFGPQKVFHSFRHTAKDGFRNSGVSEELYDRLQGHAALKPGRKYGVGQDLRNLKEAMDKLHYDVDLSHVKIG